MELPEGSLINGYVIKRKICSSELYSVYEAVDESNRTFIVKAILETTQGLSPLNSPESQLLGSFYSNGSYFLLYPAQDYRLEGNCYFTYKPVPAADDAANKGVLNGSEMSLSDITQLKSILEVHTSPGGVSTALHNSQSQLLFGELPKRKLTCSSNDSEVVLKKCTGRVHTPAPMALHLARPNTPESFDSSILSGSSDSDSGDSEEDYDSEDDSDIQYSSGYESGYSDFGSEDGEEEDSDGVTQGSFVSELYAGAGVSSGFFAVPHDTSVLRSCLDSNLSPQVPSHIQIDCPVSRFLEVKHRTIRRTPAPLGVISPVKGCSADFKNTEPQLSCDFSLKMLQSSVLRRRSVTTNLAGTNQNVS